MKPFLVAFLVIFLAAVFEAPGVSGNEFKEREAKIAEYKKWLDSLGSHGSQYWMRLMAEPRPHRLYLGEGFYRADFKAKSVSSIRFQTILQDTRKNSCLLIFSMRPPTNP